MYTVKVEFEDERQAVTINDVDAGKNLLEACLENGITLPHDCGGICSCTTCYLRIKKGNHLVEAMTMRETDMLRVKNKTERNIRLACQCLLLEGSGQLEIVIPAPAVSRFVNSEQ